MTADADALDLVDSGGPVGVTAEFGIDDTAVAEGAIADDDVVVEKLGEDAVFVENEEKEVGETCIFVDELTFVVEKSLFIVLGTPFVVGDELDSID